jgi:N-acetylneuraminic acid mutarotase
MRPRLYRTALLALVIASGSLPAQTWKQKSSMPGAARDAAICFTIGSKIYVGGGAGKDFYSYDPAADRWTKLADIPGVAAYRAFGAGFAIGELGYIGFGYDGDGSSVTLKNDLWQYDPAADRWTRKAGFPGVPRDGVTAFAVDGKAYVGGGSDNQVLYDDFYQYDPAADRWTQKHSLPTGAVIFQGTFTIGSDAYIVGGAGASESADFYRYDAEGDTWQQLAPFPGSLRQAAVAFSLDGKGYVGFGQHDYKTVYNDFYRYDPMTDTWESAGIFPTMTGRAWASATTVGNRAYVGLGWDLGSSDYQKDWWELSASMVSGVEIETTSGAASVAPNPVVDRFTLRMPGAGSGRMSLTDAVGRDVLSREISGESETVDCTALAPGLYLLRAQRGGNVMVKKIVKE